MTSHSFSPEKDPSGAGFKARTAEKFVPGIDARRDKAELLAFLGFMKVESVIPGSAPHHRLCQFPQREDHLFSDLRPQQSQKIALVFAAVGTAAQECFSVTASLPDIVSGGKKISLDL